MRGRGFGVALLCVGALGCGSGCGGGGGEGSVESQLTLTLELPAASTPDDPLQVLVQARPQTVPFDSDWSREPDDPPAEPLETERSTREYVLLRKELGDGMTNDVHVKIRFCDDAECTSQHSARWLRIRQAYYRNAQTAYTEHLGSIPARTPVDPLTIDPCDVRGCEDERPAGDDDYCRDDGTHYCQRDSGGM